ncbi:nucleotide exchange factor Sil1 [Venturia canescens]|uniref:nucleotide exchange factor Sil1 n=1 Tax=Venturia canescens TaxID=32260 RepID=UPI001C9BC1FA|nr:nucleotide exchange factor Sil1 [Venturia canescens]
MPGNILCLLFLLLCTVNRSAYTEKNDSTFVPSREWQTVHKGQPIPSGLHVRHDFQTGVTEARLLDEDSESTKDDDVNLQRKSLTLHPDESVRTPEDVDAATDNDKKYADEMKITVEELKARLKKINLLDKEIPPEMMNDRTDTETHERFKRYATLKHEFKNLEINVTTDTEMLVTYFDKFETYRDSIVAGSLSASATDDVLQILNSIEYLVHQIDNGQTFADMGGMAKIISPCFNSTNDEIKAEALRVLGAAVQSNLKVQSKALEHDFVQKLLHILATNNRATVQSRCLFALSALVRQYPAAQKALIDHGGLELFGKILEDGHLQTQSRIMKLMGDLVIERSDLNEIEDELLRRQKDREYASTDFEQKLLTHGYCKHLSDLTIKSFSNEAFGDSNIEDYDFLSVTLDSMILLGSICKRDFRAEKYTLLAVINEALRHYESVRDATSTDDDYSFSHLVFLLIRLRTRLRLFDESHDEL